MEEEGVILTPTDHQVCRGLERVKRASVTWSEGWMEVAGNASRGIRNSGLRGLERHPGEGAACVLLRKINQN